MKNAQLPAERQLPPGHLAARRDHLVGEARAESHPPNRTASVFGTRLIAIAVIVVAIGAGGLAFIGQWSDGSDIAAAAVKVNVSPVAPDSPTPLGPSQQVEVNVVKAMELRATNDQRPIVRGGSPEQQTALLQILSSLPETSITGVTVVSKRIETETGVGLEFATLPEDLPRSRWEEMLVAGVFRARSEELGLTPVVGLPPQNPDYSPSNETPADVEESIRQAASAVGAEVVQLQSFQIDGLARAVILKVDDPADFLSNDLDAFLKAIDAYASVYMASLVEVVDESGAFVWSLGWTPLLSSGSLATRPDLDTCSPIKHGHATFRTSSCPS